MSEASTQRSDTIRKIGRLGVKGHAKSAWAGAHALYKRVGGGGGGGGAKIESGSLPEIGGGSTRLLGPKKEGNSPAVVTGVLRSPCAGGGSQSDVAAVAGGGLPPATGSVPLNRHVSKLRTLNAALSERRKAECGRCGVQISKPSIVMVPDVAPKPSTQAQDSVLDSGWETDRDVGWGVRIHVPGERKGTSSTHSVADRVNRPMFCFDYSLAFTPTRTRGSRAGEDARVRERTIARATLGASLRSPHWTGEPPRST